MEETCSLCPDLHSYKIFTIAPRVNRPRISWLNMDSTPKLWECTLQIAMLPWVWTLVQRMDTSTGRRAEGKREDEWGRVLNNGLLQR